MCASHPADVKDKEIDPLVSEFHTLNKNVKFKYVFILY